LERRSPGTKKSPVIPSDDGYRHDTSTRSRDRVRYEEELNHSFISSKRAATATRRYTISIPEKDPAASAAAAATWPRFVFQALDRPLVVVAVVVRLC
jgi:hypothetical protein